MIGILAIIIFIAIIIVAQKYMKPIALLDGNKLNPLEGVWFMEGLNEKGEKGIRYNFPSIQDTSIAGFLIVKKNNTFQMTYLDSNKETFQPRFRELKYKGENKYIYEDIFLRMELELIEGVLFGTFYNALNRIFSETSKEKGYTKFKDLNLDSKIKKEIVDSVVEKESHYQFNVKLIKQDMDLNKYKIVDNSKSQKIKAIEEVDKVFNIAKEAATLPKVLPLYVKEVHIELVFLFFMLMDRKIFHSFDPSLRQKITDLYIERISSEFTEGRLTKELTYSIHEIRILSYFHMIEKSQTIRDFLDPASEYLEIMALFFSEKGYFSVSPVENIDKAKTEVNPERIGSLAKDIAITISMHGQDLL